MHERDKDDIADGMDHSKQSQPLSKGYCKILTSQFEQKYQDTPCMILNFNVRIIPYLRGRSKQSLTFAVQEIIVKPREGVARGAWLLFRATNLA